MSLTELEASYRRLNGEPRPLNEVRSLAEWIAMQVHRTPDAIAVVAPGCRWTYQQLWEAAGQVCQELQKAGIEPGQFVGVCCERRIDMPAILVGIWRAGGAYVPLDPEYPLDRLRMMASDAELQWVVGHSTQRELIEALRVTGILRDRWEADATILSASPIQSIQTSIGASHHSLISSADCSRSPAYMIYTSGSTGVPKGVVVPQRAVVNLLSSLARVPGFSSSDRILATTTLSFDISVMEMFLPLVVGGSLAVVERSVARDAEQLIHAIRELEVTVVQATPAMWRMVLEGEFSGGDHLRFFTGGEPLPRDVLRRMLPHCREVWNLYGPTETTVYSSLEQLTSADQRILIGLPIDNTQLWVVDSSGELCPPEVPGELLIGGEGLAAGYHRRPELTKEKFVEWRGNRCYRTGDLAQLTREGKIDHLGRIDSQVKLHGHRIELEEIEAVLMEDTAVQRAAVVLREDQPGQPYLAGYLILRPGLTWDESETRRRLELRLPTYMQPTRLLTLDQFPLTPSGKLDRKGFPPPDFQRDSLRSEYAPPETPEERMLVELWSELLGVSPIGVNDNFFELGGNSIRAASMLQRLKKQWGWQLSSPRFFDSPTITGVIAHAVRSMSPHSAAPKDPPLHPDNDRDLAESLVHPSPSDVTGRKNQEVSGQPDDEVNGLAGFAIVGLAARFPGAADAREFWENLVAGRETIRFFTPEELDPSLPPSLIQHPDYVAARGIVDGAEDFDAAFFAEPPRTAALIDPQQRVMLELAWQALEDAGIRIEPKMSTVGVWAGTYSSTYYYKHLLSDPALVDEVGEFALGVLNEKDYIATRIAYKLNLRGPAVNVNTACSTSLVAVGQACAALAAGDCDVALAGACSIHFPQRSGHLFQAGSIFSPDGHCRPFDAAAAGTLFSDGAGMVVLKRLASAVRDGDRIYAVIKGVGLNNDGGEKSSFSAPAISGQAAAICRAYRAAGFSPASLDYVEAHGTATPVGDPIEVAALTEAFVELGATSGRCGIGSVKGNIGHTVAAAGMAGLIKVALAMHHEIWPATLHFQKPNPAIELEGGPLRVVARREDWKRDKAGQRLRRAGVSSFGVGGTNAHVALEEAPFAASKPQETFDQNAESSKDEVEPRAAWHVWPISAKSARSLEYRLEQLRNVVAENQLACSDIAFTWQRRRTPLPHRAVVLGRTREDFQQGLADHSPTLFASRVAAPRPRPVVFMFPGQGAQYLGMGRGLWENEPYFRQTLQECFRILQPWVGRDLQDILYADAVEIDESERKKLLTETRYTQPTLFAVGYSLGRLYQRWGVQPEALIGHSIGEFAAACLAGVMSLEDGLRVIAARGSLMQELPPGGMLSVRSSAAAIESRLPNGLAIAAHNGPQLCVVAGPNDILESWQLQLESEGIVCQRLHTSHAFHSPMMDEVVEPFARVLNSVDLRRPQIPIFSTVTADWLSDAQATDPNYWAEHLRRPVLFSPAIDRLWREQPQRLLLELGPRRTLVTLAKQHAERPTEQLAWPSLGDPSSDGQDWRNVLMSVGQLWTCGVKVAWDQVFPAPGEVVSLPPYPFDRQRCFRDVPRRENLALGIALPPKGLENLDPAHPSITLAEATREDADVCPLEASGVAPSVFDSSVQPLTINPATNFQEPVMLPLRAVKQAICEVIENTSGFDLKAAPDETTFFEIGLDSLSLTQTAKALSLRFQLPLTFRQMMESTPTIGELTAWLAPQVASQFSATGDEVPRAEVQSQNTSALATNVIVAPHSSSPSPVSQMPAHSPSAETSVPTAYGAVEAALPGPTMPTTFSGASVCESNAMIPPPGIGSVARGGPDGAAAIIWQQLQLMGQQLQLLGGLASTTVTPTVAVGTPAPSTRVSTGDSPRVSTASEMRPGACSEPPSPSACPASASQAAKVIPVVSTAAPKSEPAATAAKPFGAAARVTLTDTELTPDQQTVLRELVAAYVAATPTSKQQAQRHRSYLADPRTVSGFRPCFKEMTYPIVVERSQGTYLWDVDGNRYLDLTCGFGSNFLGHGPDFMVEALTRQLHTDYSIGPQTPLAGEVARRFCELTGSERVAFANTGSEAVMGATRLARTYTGKNLIVMFNGDYHGILDEVIVRGNSAGRSFPAAMGIPADHVSQTLILDYGDPSALEIIQNRLSELAAVLVEPVQSRRPELQPKEFLQKLAKITEQAETALIMDEVISGLRIGPGGAQQYFGVQADLATYGKVVGGGMPIGVIAGRAKYMDGLDGGFWQYGDDSRPEAGMTYFAGTFCRHPLTMAAALRTLEFIQSQGQPLYDRLNRLADDMAGQLNEMFQEMGAPLTLANFGSLFKVQFAQETPFSELIFSGLRRRGYFIWDHRPCLLNIQHTATQISEFVQAFRATIAEVQRAGFLAGEGYLQFGIDGEVVPPRMGARRGRNSQGQLGWFAPNPLVPGEFQQLGSFGQPVR